MFVTVGAKSWFISSESEKFGLDYQDISIYNSTLKLTKYPSDKKALFVGKRTDRARNS